MRRSFLCALYVRRSNVTASTHLSLSFSSLPNCSCSVREKWRWAAFYSMAISREYSLMIFQSVYCSVDGSLFHQQSDESDSGACNHIQQNYNEDQHIFREGFLPMDHHIFQHFCDHIQQNYDQNSGWLLSKQPRNISHLPPPDLQ